LPLLRFGMVISGCSSKPPLVPQFRTDKRSDVKQKFFWKAITFSKSSENQLILFIIDPLALCQDEPSGFGGFFLCDFAVLFYEANSFFHIRSAPSRTRFYGAPSWQENIVYLLNHSLPLVCKIGTIWIGGAGARLGVVCASTGLQTWFLYIDNRDFRGDPKGIGDMPADISKFSTIPVWLSLRRSIAKTTHWEAITFELHVYRNTHSEIHTWTSDSSCIWWPFACCCDNHQLRPEILAE
jgi:hypothetical protein